MLDDLTSEALDKTVHSIAHAVIRLEQLAPEYGAERRRLRVLKYRGRAFRGGFHDFSIRKGGVLVFPRLQAIAVQFLAAAVARGEKAAMYVFDEELGMLFQRTRALRIDLKAMCERGDLVVEQVDAAELSPGEFAHRVTRAVEREGIGTVLIDSITAIGRRCRRNRR